MVALNGFWASPAGALQSAEGRWSHGDRATMLKGPRQGNSAPRPQQSATPCANGRERASDPSSPPHRAPTERACVRSGDTLKTLCCRRGTRLHHATQDHSHHHCCDFPRKKAADTGSLLTHFICLALGLLTMKQMEKNCIISRVERLLSWISISIPSL